MNYNKVILVGNMTRDGELKTMPNGQAVLSFGLATNRTWVDKEGQKQTKPDFHNLVMYGKRAEGLAPYLTKGKLILIEGRLTTRTWLNKESQKQSKTEIIVESLNFGPNLSGNFGGAKPVVKSEDEPEEEALPVINAGEEESPFGDEDDEIPF